MSQANPISSFGNSFSTGFWSDGDSRWRWERRRGWGKDMDHSRNSAVYPDFCGIQPSKEQKLRKRLYMLISPLALTVLIILRNLISSNSFTAYFDSFFCKYFVWQFKGWKVIIYFKTFLDNFKSWLAYTTISFWSRSCLDPFVFIYCFKVL